MCNSLSTKVSLPSFNPKGVPYSVSTDRKDITNACSVNNRTENTNNVVEDVRARSADF